MDSSTRKLLKLLSPTVRRKLYGTRRYPLDLSPTSAQTVAEIDGQDVTYIVRRKTGEFGVFRTCPGQAPFFLYGNIGETLKP